MMRVAFHAPLKPPDHPQPSGDRRMARAFIGLLASLGYEVEVASRLRSYDRRGDPERQERLRRIGHRLAERLVRRHRRRPVLERPGMWFTYHLYHKAPDHLGPEVSRGLGIPYVVAEASIAAKQAAGPWAVGFAAAQEAIRQASLVLAMTEQDHRGLLPTVPSPERLRRFPPFLDAHPFVAASRDRTEARTRLAAALGLDVRRPWLLVVAMMRADVKRLSYRLLAEALAQVLDLPWQLLLVGDGEARPEIEAWFMPRLGDRVCFLGAVPPEALAGIYAAADLYVWPACDEAYGMALLEAQAGGLPVVAGAEGGVPDIVADERTGLLTPPRQPAPFAGAVRALLTAPDRRLHMGRAAQARILAHHDVATAKDRLAAALAEIGIGRCASA
jgi:glycosyltransferase involved in cell wall biosynthesis